MARGETGDGSEGYVVGLHAKLMGKVALVNINDEEQLEIVTPEPDSQEP